MAQFVKVRGLQRRGNARLNGRNADSSKTIVLDLDDGASRRDLARHNTLGNVVVVGDTDAAVARAGAAVTPGTTTTVSLSAGSLKLDNGTGGTTTVAIPAAANQTVAANATGNPRVDLVSVAKADGAVTITAGTTVAPAVPAGNVAVALVTVPSPLGSSASYTIKDVAPRL